MCHHPLTYLPPPWGDCKASAMDSDFFSTYSLTACRIDCETRYLVENCNCRMVHMPGDAPYCTPEQYKECADPALDFLVGEDKRLLCLARDPVQHDALPAKRCPSSRSPSKASPEYLAKKVTLGSNGLFIGASILTGWRLVTSIRDFLVERDNDYCVCETPCNMTRYGKEMSFVKIPSKASAKYLAKNDNILVLDIFFEALNYETIEQKKAYELAGLLGDIGGQMGLFIGASILTVLEIFDYLYEVEH
ncbi:hypothetical protein CRUP_023858 [Coryphaenoides rupestris]|nr:hypothetical protein CRUP_023858 [Coryphaenoides rupestris]